MRRALALALLVLVAALPGCDLLSGGDDSGPSSVPSFEERSPVAGQPPIAWVSGVLQEIGDERVTVRDASETLIAMQRLTGGATRFLSADGDGWRELSEDETATVGVGVDVCAEVLLDGSNFVALRVFLDASCGPTGAAP